VDIGHIEASETVRTFVYEGPKASMKEFERKQLLERIEREGATVGTSIPETIVVQGEEIDLREFVFEIKQRDTVPPGERDRVERAKRNLRRERLQRKQRIEEEENDEDSDELTFEEGEQLVESIIGIDRALSSLQNLDSSNIEGEIASKEAADTKRWMNFLNQVLGKESSSRRRR
jgi:hypothetical protein